MLCNTPSRIPDRIKRLYALDRGAAAEGMRVDGVGGWCRRTLGYRLDVVFFFSSRRRHTILQGDWSSDVCLPISIHIFETPQLVAPGRTEPRRTLPSFLFLEDGQPVGVYAREQGALVPTKLVHSAKSWLSNPDVDRTAKILPWDSPETGRVLSPVEVSSRYIAAFRDAWDTAWGNAKHLPLADQDIVLTVPPSFDEEDSEVN